MLERSVPTKQSRVSKETEVRKSQHSHDVIDTKAMLITRRGGKSLEVQGLSLRLPMQGVWVRFLVRELRPHMPGGQKIKT